MLLTERPGGGEKAAKGSTMKSNLPERTVREINTAIEEGDATAVSSRFEDLKPVLERRRKLAAKPELDDSEAEELAGITDLLEVAERDGWHAAPESKVERDTREKMANFINDEKQKPPATKGRNPKDE